LVQRDVGAGIGIDRETINHSVAFSPETPGIPYR